MYSFANLKDPIRTAPGIAERVLYALTDWFEDGGIKGPGAWADYGDEVRIKASHVFKPGEGFIECTLAPEKNSYDAKTIGDTGLQKFANEAKLMLPGSYASLHEILFNLAGKPVIVLIQDSECQPAKMWYQLGTDCIPARISAEFATGSTKEGTKGYLLTVTNTAEKVLLYEGDITYPGEGAVLVARITGEVAGSSVTLDASTSAIFGVTVYEYKVLFNDSNGDPQQVILPETGDNAAFDTAVLADWNGAGFAIVLTISNGVNEDKTRTADITGDGPLQMGGFDEGFDTGFDFNINET